MVSGSQAEEVFLTKQGQPTAVVLVQEEDPLFNPPGGWKPVEATVEQAAEELVGHVRRMSGAELPVLRIRQDQLPGTLEQVRAEGKVPVLLGSLALKQLEPRSAEMDKALDDPSGFVVQARADQILLAGSSPSAVAFAVYALLEDLGVRWFFPGELGTVIPRQADLAVTTGETVEKPSLAARQFQLKNGDLWARRQRAGGLYFPSAHGIPLGQDVSLETHPELYALVKGERTARQLCLSNPEVLRRAVEQTRRYFRENPEEPWMGLGPNDGGGFCECAACREMDGGDTDPFSGGPSMTDRYVDFFNRMLVELEGEFPDKQLAFYIYHNYMRPPVRVKPSPRIAGAIAPIALCRIHGLNNPVCPERGYLKTLIDQWKAVLPNLYERGYWYNLADPGMLFIQTHRLRDEIPYFARQGVQGYRTECMGHWALQGPSLYMAGKLMWNAKADPDAITRDFCEKLFGPAAAPMEAYFRFLDEHLRDADHHTGGALNMLQIYPPAIRDQARGRLKEAERLAGDSPWKERVEAFARGFAYFDAFARILEGQNRQDWTAAFQALREMEAQAEFLSAGEFPLLAEASAKSHFSRFFRPTVEQGQARTTGGNVMVAPLGREWDFLLDPQGIGEELHYERPEWTGGNWQTLSTEVPWSDQGLRYYKGLAWYRQKVTVPKSFAGKRVFLWFGGVDEAARVWVNGKLVGTSPSSAFTPFEVDATTALRPGENTVVVCVANLKVNELGAGGITAPGFLYAPAKGEAAELENLKPLRETFP